MAFPREYELFVQKGMWRFKDGPNYAWLIFPDLPANMPGVPCWALPVDDQLLTELGRIVRMPFSIPPTQEVIERVATFVAMTKGTARVDIAYKQGNRVYFKVGGELAVERL